MTESRRPKRGKEILKVLKDHGPLSIEVLGKMTKPEMKPRRLRKSIAILKKKGFVMSRWVSRSKTFYQICQTLENRTRTANFLNCAPDELFQPLIRRRDWMHAESCEYWIHLISGVFPEAKIIRDTEFSANREALRTMLLSHRECDLFPDFLVMFPEANGKLRTSLAFEIERTRKSNARLVAKLDKYANRSFVDGLIYVCELDRLDEAIRLLYQDRIVEKAHRIKHYGDNFFLFSDATNSMQFPLERLFNMRGKNISIENWCHLLRSTKRTLRRNEQFH